ncbi:bifunctional 2-C-methyl-D-erythritol 4-phosphate cytidylyltransferase/2-C-methyl-D-erythritol 2,4-cyclodiphosphate synthase [Bauldia sp.]|uniref:bifunctional 2-C-methyl-D-erythritol 4-phosphate cytidylyltransferase/2-C-methyl-D-erythritol 2,4-cyclodiphosphate synthase n=1 Tax=Bauldia sp. TaxID=2575872 RepID=UPI003BA89734
MSQTTVLIVAAGRGARAGDVEIPKQYKQIGGIPVLRHSLDTYLSHPRNFNVLVVIAECDSALYEETARDDPRLRRPVDGGPTRQASVYAGLRRLADAPPDTVLIHDAARPFVTPDLIERVASGLDRDEAVLPAMPIASTLKSVEEDGLVTGTIPRDGLYAAQTPQGFHYPAILSAHTQAAKAGLAFTDDAAVAEWAGIPVRIVPGDAGNTKLTTAEDMAVADRRLTAENAAMLTDIRVGFGYDVHAFGGGESVMIGGIEIPSDRGVISHSDGDVALHALTDALLGTIGDGDIGDHFPPSDPIWKDAPSEMFLRFAAGRIKSRGGIVANLDVTIMTEAPRIATYRDAMRKRIAEICAIAIDRVSVKATTSEQLGFVGRREGLAASATATVRLPLENGS